MTVPLWWSRLCRAALVASLGAVLVLWLPNAGGGVRQLGAGLVVTASLGRLCALLCAELLLVQVLLMARIPLLERAFGRDQLARAHAVVGATSFGFLLLHLLLTMTAYARIDGLSLLGGTLYDTLHYPGLLPAMAGTALIVAVAVSSARWIRRRLRYETWHLLHAYAYLGVGLSLPHQLWIGSDFVRSPVARAYWWTMYLAAAGSVLLWRVALPLWRSAAHQVRVVSVVPEAPGIVSVYMRGRELHRLGAAGGQFFFWRFLDGPGWTRAHPYSLSAAPQSNRLRITVKSAGDGTDRLARVRPGTRVLIEGPYGRLHPGVRSRPRVTLLASGIGITPMRALMEEIDHVPGELTLIYRASTDQDLALRDEIDQVAARTGARVHYVVGPRAKGRRPSWLPEQAGHLGDAEALLELVPDLAAHEVFICGGDTWMGAARDAACAAGVPRRHVHLERFSS